MAVDGIFNKVKIHLKDEFSGQSGRHRGSLRQPQVCPLIERLLIWSLIFAFVIFVLTPIISFIRQLIHWITKLVTYCKNGFKWPDERLNPTLMLGESEYVRNYPRSGRNHYGVLRLKY